MKKFYFLLFALFCVSFTFSQSNLKGRVLDSNGFPLPGATIIVDNDKGTVSDFNRFYRFIDLESGNSEISVSYIGFEGVTASVEIAENATTTTSALCMGFPPPCFGTVFFCRPSCDAGINFA